MLKDRTGKTKNLLEGLGANKSSSEDDSTNVNIGANANIDNNIKNNNDTIVDNSDSIDSPNVASDFSQLLSGKQSEEMVMKGLYLRKDQVESLECYSKMANKSYSEFVRDALDMVFAEIEKAQR